MSNFTLPKLKYSYTDLEPHIDAKTMEIHHTKHHAGYVNKLNTALEQQPKLHNKTIEEILLDIDNVDKTIKQAVINNGGGHANHSLFWNIMNPSSKKSPTGKLLNEINKKFGNFDSFKETFKQKALTRFGSGWAWLVVKDNKMEIISTPNQDSPLMDDFIPVLGLDIWEHAYYLNYQNKRGDYVDSFWNVVDWKIVETMFLTTQQ